MAQMVRFIKPALYFHEQKWARGVTAVLLLSWLLSTGVTPLVCQTLIDALMQWIPSPVTPLWGLGAYVDFLLVVLLATASSLLLAEMMIMAAFWGWLTYTSLKKAQKGAILGSLILGALLTPPDVLSQVALASVLLLAYYLALAIAGIKERLQRKN
jgi:sec-independent protein translocase protein TatC